MMKKDEENRIYQQNIERLRGEVSRKFGRLPVSMADFELLSEKTKISVQTLRRFYGKIDKEKRLGATSLNLLCTYIGVFDWEHFCPKQMPNLPPPHATT